ncbi:zinc finger protein 385C isoform X2 [Hippoglossus stenolepis]|uniref:zinc finger protein 385C isoform X2 n=1 Tax=Hippoglossus stenolepis TaxID=195615 RepID=UPI00159C9485|nr:zinc finger protein 385C isoform X2 [Hippoglossus stenolepis]
MLFGALSQSQVHPLLGSLPLPGRPLQAQSHAQLEHFLPLRVNGSSPLSLFPNFNTMDPVQKAVINHTFGVTPPKKKPIISCNICHLRFNSTTQAEAHYKGHKHARKLKALETQRNRHKNGHGPSTAGKDRERGMMGGATVPRDLSHMKDKKGPTLSSPPAQQQTEITQGSSLAAPPSSQPTAVDSLLRSPQVSPQVSPGSQLSDLPSESPPVDGISLATSSAPRSDPQGGSTGGAEEEEVVKVDEAKEAKSNKNKPLLCPTCKVTVNSSSQLDAHCSGSKHKQMLDGQNSSQSQRRVKMTSSPRPASSRIKQRMGSKTRAVVCVSSQPFHCELCQVSVNSETQLKQHMNSRRHKERLAGKPVKTKFSPYNKLQASAILATKLALQKHLCKALPAGFLTSPLNPAAFCTMGHGPLALRLQPGPTAILQGPLISPTLFRPAPGPLRATHAPIIFSPY